MSTHREPQSAATEAEENMAAFEAGLARIEADFRARLPEFFDEWKGFAGLAGAGRRQDGIDLVRVPRDRRTTGETVV
jgi:hypothetical protein